MRCRDHRPAPGLGHLGGLDHCREHLDRAHRYCEALQAGCAQGVDERRDDLGVGGGTVHAHELDSDLRELPSLAAQRLMLAEGLGRVA